MYDQSREDIMVMAAWLYYAEGLTQVEVAERLNLTRVTVTRLLQAAREKGIVRFTITKPMPSSYRMALELEKKAGLEKAIVVKGIEKASGVSDPLGQAGAEYLTQLIFKECRLGIGWSTTVSRIAPYLVKSDQKARCIINELAGSMLGVENPYSISARVADIFDVPIETLPVPALVHSKNARDAILEEPSIQMAMENAAKCDFAFVGLGEVGVNNTMVRTGYLTESMMHALEHQGAVGEILMRYFNINGEQIMTPLDDRIISLSWEALSKIPHIVVMAAGKKKVDALIGVLRGRLLHCLITDEETAQLLLQDPRFGDEDK